MIVVQSESVVNSGPAIFISPTGPNPMMVQVSTCSAWGVSVLNALVWLSSFDVFDMLRLRGTAKSFGRVIIT